MRSFLKNRRFKLDSKIDCYNLCRNYEKAKEKLCDIDLVKNNISLRSFYDIKNNISTNNFKNSDRYIRKSIDSIGNKMITIYSGFETPESKSKNIFEMQK